jgi:hypothetical protein
MAESDDKRELSGLARSIDALFSSPARDARTRADAATMPHPPEPAYAPEDEDGWVDPGAHALSLEGLAPDPALEEEAGWAPPEGTAPSHETPERRSDALPGPASDWGLQGPADEPPHEEADAVWPLGAPPPVEETGASGPDPDAFASAVQAYLAGTPGAAADVEELAIGLRERFALDPLADAVERLAREAGDPPDPTLVDMARGIINPAVASRIVQRIGHERDEQRVVEYTVLCKLLGEVMAKAFRGALTGATEREARRLYFDILVAMGDTSRPIIEGMVGDENTLLVRSGVAMLGEAGGARSVELVTSALAHPDARVRREALLSLAKLGDEGSGALVVGFLEDTEPEVRVAAATAAGALKVDRALRHMLALLEAEGDGENVPALLDALGKLGDPGAVPAIERHAVKTLFSKPSTETRVAAYRALHAIGTPHARDLVQQALSDKEPGVRAAVRGIVGPATR